MLTQLTTRKLDVPGEEGEWIEVRPLSGRRKREAIEAQSGKALQAMLQQMSALSPEDRAVLLSAEAEAAKAAAAAGVTSAKDSDPYAQFDQVIVLASSIVAWSYSEPVTPENIDDLDPGTQDFVFRELVRPLVQRAADEKLERFFASTPA